MNRLIAALVSGMLWASGVAADEVPIAGTIKAVDPAAQTLSVESAVKGKTRVVVIHMRPGSKIIRFVRSADAKGGFAEQALTLDEIKPGWIVSVKTRHDGELEVAELVRIVHEK